MKLKKWSDIPERSLFTICFSIVIGLSILFALSLHLKAESEVLKALLFILRAALAAFLIATTSYVVAIFATEPPEDDYEYSQEEDALEKDDKPSVKWRWKVVEENEFYVVRILEGDDEYGY